MNPSKSAGRGHLDLPFFPKTKKENRYLFWGVLFIYLVFSLFTFRDYAITWDENDNYHNGGQYLRYYMEPWTGDHLDLGTHPASEGATHNYLYAAVLDLLNLSKSYERFHLLNLLFGALAFAAAYKVLLGATRSDGAAWIGCFFLFLTPRFLGELPNNPKDSSFAVLYFVSLAGIYIIPRKVQGRWLQAFLIGTLVGVTTCLRILGLTLLPVLVIHRVWEYRQGSGEKKSPAFGSWLSGEIVPWTLAFLFSQFWMRMLWPYLDDDYFHGLLNVFKDSKDYYWDGLIMFMGHLIHPSDRLGWYLPVWIGVTTPLFLLAFFIFSFFIPAKAKETNFRSLYVLMAAALLINLLLYFTLRPTIYNGLRHYLFLLPILAVMSAMGFIEFVRGRFSKNVKTAVLVLVSANVLMVLVQMARLYPYPYLYFNETVGGLHGAYGKFETDYWGESLKEASQWLAAEAAREPNRHFNVKTSATCEQETYYFKSNMQGGNAMKDPDYWIALNIERDFQLTPDLKEKVAFTVRREGVPLAYVLKMK